MKKIWMFILVALLVGAFGCEKVKPEATKVSETTEATKEEVEEAVKEEPAKADEVPAQDEAAAKPDAAPAVAPYKVKLDTTAGEVIVEVHPDWAPNGAARFKELVEAGYFTDIAIFRVIDGFMAQFGIHGDPKVMAQWRDKKIPDDPRKEGISNKPGYLTFATAGPNTRTTQLFINYGDNSRLDSQGFTPIGKVSGDGMAVVEKFYKGYGEGAPMGKGPAQGRIQAQGNEYLKAEFPELTYIKSASIVE